MPPRAPPDKDPTLSPANACSLPPYTKNESSFVFQVNSKEHHPTWRRSWEVVPTRSKLERRPLHYWEKQSNEKTHGH